MKPWHALLAFTIGTSAVCAIAHPSQASTDFPMRISTSEGIFSIVVPDTDTTRSAYGGRLRVYDVHLAKMFEVTHQMCSMRRLSPSATWTYTAGDGELDMGSFQISCDLASDIATAYGLGKPERTSIYFSAGESEGSTREEGIPILNITGGKIDRWMTFTRNFKPMR